MSLVIALFLLINLFCAKSKKKNLIAKLLRINNAVHYVRRFFVSLPHVRTSQKMLGVQRQMLSVILNIDYNILSSLLF